MSKRYFEFHGADTKRGTASSSKFWEVWLEESILYTRFGKIGANGQTTMKECPTVDAAETSRDKLIAEKLRKGYVEKGVAAPHKTDSSAVAVETPNGDGRWNSEQIFTLSLESETAKRLFAEHSSSPKILAVIARDDSEEVRRNGAENPKTPVDLLTTLADDDTVIVRAGVAKNPNTPVHLLTTLADDDEGMVRAGVAVNSKTPVNLLTTLAHDDELIVRVGAAKNPNTPVHLLTTLADDDEGMVRAEVALNPNTPVNVLTALAHDDDEWVRVGAAKNPNTPVHLLTTLADDDEGMVRAGVAMNTNTPVDLLTTLTDDDDRVVREWLAGNPKTPVNLLTTLAHDDDEMVRAGVAMNPNSPAKVLKTLAEDDSEFVRWWVAKNPNMSPKALMTLAEDGDEDVRAGVARNPSTPLDTWTSLLERIALEGDFDDADDDSDEEWYDEEDDDGFDYDDAPHGNSCSSCGEPLSAGEKFCSSCGKKVVEIVHNKIEDFTAVAEWMMSAIVAMRGNIKIKRVGFLAGAESTLVFSVEFYETGFDVRLHRTLLDLDTLLGEGYLEFTEPDALEPNLYLHVYLLEDDFADLGSHITESIARMIASDEWMKVTTTVGGPREKVEVEKWV